MKTISVEECRKAAFQYLNGLKQAGLQTVPVGTGRQICDFVDHEGESPTSQWATNVIGQPAIGPADRVNEPQLNYQQNELLVERADTTQVPTSSIVRQAHLANQSKIFETSTSGQLSDQRPYPNAMPVTERERELNELKSGLKNCVRCSELANCRHKIVFGSGNLQPRLVFLGEAPGADEDRQGEPFVGAAGQLLNKIITACKLRREDVYILNTIKCRPPNNRNPLPEELANCWEHTERQLEVLRPEYICCLGLIATKQLLKTDQPLGRLRQRFHRYRDSRVLVTYHPAYLLRTESAKKHVWEDMQMLMREMGIELTR